VSDAVEGSFVLALSRCRDGVNRWADGTPISYTHLDGAEGHNGGSFNRQHAWIDKSWRPATTCTWKRQRGQATPKNWSTPIKTKRR
jgi:hypothetical protein